MTNDIYDAVAEIRQRDKDLDMPLDLSSLDQAEQDRRSLLKIIQNPIPMILFCPVCHFQHIDEPDFEIGWANPPHKSHLCLNPVCSVIWRPADIETTGVAATYNSR